MFHDTLVPCAERRNINMKTLVVGNGIDIQYGSFDKRGNKAIIDRAINNVKDNKYQGLDWQKDSVMDALYYCVETINRVIRKEDIVPKDKDYVFLQMELERIRRTYLKDIGINEIGLEDIFLGAELLYLNSQNEQERKLVDSIVCDYIQPLLLDAIYDDGSVNEIYKNFPKSLITYLKKYDAIFTLNYDMNLERALEYEVPVYHLHGSFDDLLEKSDVVDDEFKHMYCNGIMTWYWLDKYGKEEKDRRYGLLEFENIEGTVDILGISPCNDEQLYIRLNLNKKLTACNYFYFEKEEAVEIRNHIRGGLEGHITNRDVKKFWKKFK